jgi:hypothetical protein
MAKYRVKTAPRTKYSPQLGTVFDWDGSTVDSDGDIVVNTDDFYGWVGPECVEPVEAPRTWKVGDRARLLEGARAKGHGESHTLDTFDSRYVTGAEVVVVQVAPALHHGDILVKLNGDLWGGWWVDPRFLAPTEPPKKAEVVEETIERIVTETKKTVVIRLTEDEAKFLRTLLGWHIIGPFSSPGRRESNTIKGALDEAGIEDDPTHFNGRGTVDYS